MLKINSMENNEHLQAIENQIKKAVFNYVSAQETIKHYRVRSVERVSIEAFKQEPNIKDLFTGKGSTASVKGNIRLFHWTSENSWTKLDLNFWARDLNIHFDSEADQFVVDNHFEFVPLLN